MKNENKKRTNLRTAPPSDSLRNWKEDLSHENGNYHNVCSVCESDFIGYKRRVVCKVCDSKNRLFDLKAYRTGLRGGWIKPEKDGTFQTVLNQIETEIKELENYLILI